MEKTRRLLKMETIEKTDDAYAEHFFRLNPIRPNEESYYAGLTGRNPHGIKDSIWRKEYLRAKSKGYFLLDD
jgi:hypothetical protein